MAEFALDISRFADKAVGNYEKVVQKTSVDLFSRTVERTPVGNPDTWKSPAPAGYVGGRLRANWNCSIGSGDTSTSEETDKGGAITKARIRAALHSWNEGDIYLMNSLPYAIAIEHGHSGQAPKGMVKITVTEFQTFINKAIAELPN